MRAYIYARFSSDRQDENSITAQVRACREYAAHHNIEIVRVYADEAVSGKGSATAKRAQYQKMLRAVASRAEQVDVILIHKYDRIARSVQEHVNLASKLAASNVELIATAQDFGTSKEAKLMRVLMWALSEFYIDNLADEVKKGHRETALKALHNGGYPPFGYDVVDQKYVINQTEAAYVRRMFQTCLSGEKYTDLLYEMRTAGITGKRGRPIQYTAIYEILRNEKYTGVYVYTPSEEVKRSERRSKPNAIRIENAFPAIIDRKTWEEVQKIMDARKNSGRRAKREYLLSGLIFCECGAPMHGLTTTRRKNGSAYQYSYYTCSAKCGNQNIRAEDAEGHVLRYLHMLADDRSRAEFKTAASKYKRLMSDAMSTDAGAIKEEIAVKEAQINKIVKNLSASVLPPSVVEKMGQEMEQLQIQIDMLKAEMEKPISFEQPEIEKYLDALKDVDNQSPKFQKDTIRQYIDRIEITKTGINVTSTLPTVLENIGCGGMFDIFPKIFFTYKSTRPACRQAKG